MCEQIRSRMLKIWSSYTWHPCIGFEGCGFPNSHDTHDMFPVSTILAKHKPFTYLSPRYHQVKRMDGSKKRIPFIEFQRISYTPLKSQSSLKQKKKTTDSAVFAGPCFLLDPCHCQIQIGIAPASHPVALPHGTRSAGCPAASGLSCSYPEQQPGKGTSWGWFPES